MAPSDSVKTYRDEALRRIGRNLVNFQRLEASLRQLVPALNLGGALPEISSLQASRKRELKKKSLGHLAERFHADVFRGEQDAPHPASPTEITFAHSFRIEATPSQATERRKTLAGLVRERNRLVHIELLGVDFNSIADCEDLSAHLDEQNERICEYLSYVNALLQSHSEALAELVKFINSEEFLKLLESERDDA
jgi:hypothetical protein